MGKAKVYNGQGLSFSTYGDLVENELTAAQVMCEIVEDIESAEAAFRIAEESYKAAHAALSYQLSQLDNALNHGIKKGYLKESFVVKRDGDVFGFAKDEDGKVIYSKKELNFVIE